MTLKATIALVAGEGEEEGESFDRWPSLLLIPQFPPWLLQTRKKCVFFSLHHSCVANVSSVISLAPNSHLLLVLVVLEPN